MSASQTPSPTPSEAQEILKNIADLLCRGHKHHISAPQITPGVPTRHSMVIVCPQEGDIKWQVGMSADFVKVIRRCKDLPDCKFLCPHRPNILLQNAVGALTGENGYNTPGHPDVTTFAPLSAWEGEQCEDILWLLGIGHLKEGWWEDNPSRLSDQRKDYTYGFSFPYFLHSFFLPSVSQLLDGTKKRLPVSVY